MHELKKKVRELEKAMAGAESDKPSSDDDMEDEAGGEQKTLGELLASLAALTKNLGADDPATRAMAARVQEARQRRDADKTPFAKAQVAVRRRDKAQKALDKAVAAEAAAKERAAKAQEEALQATDAVREAQKLLGQETAALAELQEALAKDSAAKAKAAGYRAPAAEPELLVPGAVALLAGCVDPKVHEALAHVQRQLQERQREAAAAEQRERDREHQMAE